MNSDGNIIGRTVNSSKVEMTELVLPNDTNFLGNLLGGKLMHWLDIAGAMVASRHSNGIVATVTIDNIDFKRPIHMGEVLIIKAKLTWAGNTSMEVALEAYSENIMTGDVTLTNDAHIVFVALDDKGKKRKVPPLILETEEEKDEFQKAQERRTERIRRKEQ